MTLDNTSLRTYMGLQNVTSISDDEFTGAIEDAGTMLAGVSDELALKYYSAYLLAKGKDWMTIKKTGNVEFNVPNPNTYKELYDMRSDQLEAGSGDDGEISGFAVYDPKFD